MGLTKMYRFDINSEARYWFQTDIGVFYQYKQIYIGIKHIYWFEADISVQQNTNKMTKCLKNKKLEAVTLSEKHQNKFISYFCYLFLTG